MAAEQDLPPLEFTLTPQDRDRAKLAAVHIEAHRRAQNQRDAFRALAKWTGAQHRPREEA